MSYRPSASVFSIVPIILGLVFIGCSSSRSTSQRWNLVSDTYPLGQAKDHTPEKSTPTREKSPAPISALSLGTPGSAHPQQPPSPTASDQCFTRVTFAANTGAIQVLKRAPMTLPATAPPLAGPSTTVQRDPARQLDLDIPEAYVMVQDSLLVHPAGTSWQRCVGWNTNAAQRVEMDPQTGERRCLVETKADYKVVERRILKRPGLKQHVPAFTQVPATASAASPQVQHIPAQFVRFVPTPSTPTWKQVLCETDYQPAFIRPLQQALQLAGFYRGRVNGVYGPDTDRALAAYKQQYALAGDGITFEVLLSLGIDPGPGKTHLGPTLSVRSW